ncbi:MAG: septum formation initiator family protein [Blautia sp.]
MRRKKKRNRQNRIAMFSVTFVMVILVIALMVGSHNLRVKINGYKEQKQEVCEKIEEEKKRTEEIEQLEEYMKSDEYARQVARDKLGLVGEDEIIFKEEE